MQDKLTRKHICFYGNVQGVGFRYRAYHAAGRIGATGWVRNCPDGSVEMEIQGTDYQIDDVLGKIMGGKYINVHDMKVKTIDVIEERSFCIR